MQEHYRALERMYARAPINEFYPPEISVSHGRASVSLQVRPAYFHTLNAMHGSVYFKLLDDSAAFAALSLSDVQAMVTAKFTISFRAPVSDGKITATAEVVHVDGRKVFVEATLNDEEGNEIASGEGLFLPAKLLLADVGAYQR